MSSPKISKKRMNAINSWIKRNWSNKTVQEKAKKDESLRFSDRKSPKRYWLIFDNSIPRINQNVNKF